VTLELHPLSSSHRGGQQPVGHPGTSTLAALIGVGVERQPTVAPGHHLGLTVTPVGTGDQCPVSS
jgi:hypothetical protein